MNSIKVIKTGKKQKLLIDGHFFIKFHEADNIISWWCDKKGTLKCNSIVKTLIADGTYEIKEGPTEHDHKDPKNRKLIVATPKNVIIGKTKKLSIKLARTKLDFEEKSAIPVHSDSPKNIIASETTSRESGKIPYADKPIAADFGVQTIKLVKWKEGKLEKLFIDGYYYSFVYKRRFRCSWACNLKNCNARVTTTIADGAHVLKSAPNLKQHNHDVTTMAPSLKRYFDEMEKGTNGDSTQVKKKRKSKDEPVFTEKKKTKEGSISPKNEQSVCLEVSMHTQLMSHLPQADIMQFPPPTDYEIEVVILFGLRRQMLPEQIFYECQSTYGVHAPSFQTVSQICERFQNGYYPTDVTGSEKWINDKKFGHVMNENYDPNISREFLTVQPDI